MLAPRKKLWSTPKEALIKAIEVLNIQPNDIVYDIGCGDGNFLFHCLDSLYNNFIIQRHLTQADLSPLQIIGVDIEEERIQSIHEKIQELRRSELYEGETGQVMLECVKAIQGNALEFDYSQGTCFYLYLISRGLRQIIEILVNNIHHPFRVVTFMYPIPNYRFLAKVEVHSEKHEGSQWPLYYYEFPSHNKEKANNPATEEGNEKETPEELR